MDETSGPVSMPGPEGLMGIGPGLLETTFDQLRTLLPEDLAPDEAPAVDWTPASPEQLRPPSDPTAPNTGATP